MQINWEILRGSLLNLVDTVFGCVGPNHYELNWYAGCFPLRVLFDSRDEYCLVDKVDNGTKLRV